MDLKAGLTIDRTNLDEELSKQAANYLFVAERAVNAEAEYELFKAKVSQLEAALDSSLRMAAEDNKVKLTETALRMGIERDATYGAAMRQKIELRAKKEALRALRESWYARKDLLIQLAIKARSEMEAMLSETVRT